MPAVGSSTRSSAVPGSRGVRSGSPWIASIAKNHTATTAAPANLYAAVAATTQATTRQDWAALYQLTSQATLGGLSAAEFAQVMERQTQAVGSITSITATSQPQLGSDPTGITFFTVTEHVTVLHNAVLKSFDVIAVYILEGGAWKLWFTKQL